MTTSEQRAELVRRTREYIERHCSDLKQRRLEQGRGPFMIEELADALEASEAEKRRLIEAVRAEMHRYRLLCPTGEQWIDSAERLRTACTQAEEGP